MAGRKHNGRDGLDGSTISIYNEHYSTDEEFVYALADAMSDKYRAIVESGFILQIDDPGIAPAKAVKNSA